MAIALALPFLTSACQGQMRAGPAQPCVERLKQDGNELAAKGEHWRANYMFTVQGAAPGDLQRLLREGPFGAGAPRQISNIATPEEAYEVLMSEPIDARGVAALGEPMLLRVRPEDRLPPTDAVARGCSVERSGIMLWLIGFDSPSPAEGKKPDAAQN